MAKKSPANTNAKTSDVNRRNTRSLKEIFARAKMFQQARAAVASYQVVVQKVDDRWHGRGLEMPDVCGDGETAEKCVANTRDAMIAAVVQLLESREPIPAAADADIRTEQVFIRLTKAERRLLEAAAAKKGIKRLSDFMRAVALEATTH
jgi:predicted RNase H-like HicB family nuclease